MGDSAKDMSDIDALFCMKIMSTHCWA